MFYIIIQTLISLHKNVLKESEKSSGRRDESAMDNMSVENRSRASEKYSYQRMARVTRIAEQVGRKRKVWKSKGQ